MPRLVVGAALVVLGACVLLILVAGALQRGPIVSTAAPSASATALGSEPAATSAAATGVGPSASSVASARYGYISLGQNAFDLRTETGDVVMTYGCGGPGRPCDAAKIAVSPDGKRIAFWTAAQLPEWTLMVVDAAAPLAPHPVATIAAPQIGGTIAWSTDSQGILYSAVVERQGGPVGGPGSARMSALDLTTGRTQADVMPARSDGTFYIPLAWDRATSLFAAVRTGEGGFIVDYDVMDASGYRTSKTPEGSTVAGAAEASSDATRVLVVDRRTNTVLVWPIDDAAKAVGVGAGAGRAITAAHWMPDSRSIAWSGDTQFGTLVADTGSSRVVYGASGGVALVALRPDGSAALLSTTGGQQVTDIQSGASTPVRIGDRILARGVLLH